MKNSQLRVLCGNSNKALAEEIVKHLDIKITPSEIKKFSDGEISVKICESVRYDDVYIVQSTSHPGNDHIMELMLMVDAAMRASARTITVIIPYYGYSRQDRKVEPRVPISAKVIANMLQSVGVDRVITMDLHSDQTQGFFDIPVDNLFAAPIIVDYIESKKFEDLVIVSPDAGGVNRARFHAKKLGAGLAIVDKRRAKANVSEVMHVIGDVKDKVCILIDDMIDTAGSITGAGKALVENGAKEVYCLATHGVLSGPAVERLNDSVFKEVILTNTIPLPAGEGIKNVKVVSVAGIFAEAIMRIYKGESVSTLFI